MTKSTRTVAEAFDAEVDVGLFNAASRYGGIVNPGLPHGHVPSRKPFQKYQEMLDVMLDGP